MRLRGGVEPPLFLISKRVHHPLSQLKRGSEISFLPTGFIEVNQSFCQIGIVLQYPIEMGSALPRGSEQRSLGSPVHQQEEVCRPHSPVDVAADP